MDIENSTLLNATLNEAPEYYLENLKKNQGFFKKDKRYNNTIGKLEAFIEDRDTTTVKELMDACVTYLVELTPKSKSDRNKKHAVALLWKAVMFYIGERKCSKNFFLHHEDRYRENARYKKMFSAFSDWVYDLGYNDGKGYTDGRTMTFCVIYEATKYIEENSNTGGDTVFETWIQLAKDVQELSYKYFDIEDADYDKQEFFDNLCSIIIFTPQESQKLFYNAVIDTIEKYIVLGHGSDYSGLVDIIYAIECWEKLSIPSSIRSSLENVKDVFNTISEKINKNQSVENDRNLHIYEDEDEDDIDLEELFGDDFDDFDDIQEENLDDNIETNDSITNSVLPNEHEIDYMDKFLNKRGYVNKELFGLDNIDDESEDFAEYKKYFEPIEIDADDYDFEPTGRDDGSFYLIPKNEEKEYETENEEITNEIPDDTDNVTAEEVPPVEKEESIEHNGDDKKEDTNEQEETAKEADKQKEETVINFPKNKTNQIKQSTTSTSKSTQPEIIQINTKLKSRRGRGTRSLSGIDSIKNKNPKDDK